MKLNRGVQYYWKVIPLDSEGKMIGSVESEVTRFKTPNPLDGLSLNSPVNVEIPSLKPTFSWSGIEEISLYTILLSSDDELSEIFWENSTSETQIIYPEEGLKLKYGTTYSWQVVPVDADGNSMKEAKSGVAKFQTPAVEPLVLNEPLNTAVNNLTPLFSWEAVDGTASYNLEISQSEEMSDLIFNSATNSPEFNYTGEPPLDNSSTYYWRIQALDENGNLVGSMSNVAFFSTPLVDEIELTSPLNIAVSSLTPTFSWRTLENAVAYRISIVMDGEVISNSEVENGETVYPGDSPLVYETTYFWNVQPIDVDGNDFSINPQATFITPKLIKISLKSPVSEEVTSLTPDLSWAGIDVAAGYFVEVSKGEETSPFWSGSFSMTNITFLFVTFH